MWWRSRYHAAAALRGSGIAHHGEQVVLLQLKEATLRNHMEVVEAAWHSARAANREPQEVFARRAHRFLTLKFTNSRTQQSAQRPSRGIALRGVATWPRQAKQSRPPNIGVEPRFRLCELLKPSLLPSKTLEQAHKHRSAPASTRFYAVDESASSVRDIVSVEWADDLDKVKLTAATSFAKDIPEDLKAKVVSAAAMEAEVSRFSFSGSVTCAGRQAAQHFVTTPGVQRVSGGGMLGEPGSGGRARPGRSQIGRSVRLQH